MTQACTLSRQLYQDTRGTMMIETAIVAPVLLLMSMGAFQVSQVVAQQTDLQNAAAQAASIAIASPPDTAEKRTTLRNIVVVSTGLPADQVTVTPKFRCGTAIVYENSTSSCVGTRVSEFVLIQLRDTYTPIWTEWGVSQPIAFNVDRYVMIKQS